jgi:hypothetical protein
VCACLCVFLVCERVRACLCAVCVRVRMLCVLCVFVYVMRERFVCVNVKQDVQDSVCRCTSVTVAIQQAELI